ncbi:RNA-directed DNA polymerase, eukaryota [Tanacetum coccineum]
MDLNRRLQDIKLLEVKDLVQKSKIKWAIEGDENSKFFHGIINKKRSQLSIRGVFVEGTWCTDPSIVKEAFKNHFEVRFQQPCHDRLKFMLLLLSVLLFGSGVGWIGQYRGTKFVGLFGTVARISLLAPMVIRLNFLESIGVLWIRGTFTSSMASILVNGSPTSEFPFCCGLKQGDPLAPYLFILIMESLHISFSRVVDDGLRRNRIGCAVLNTPFRYLGVTVGECMSRKSAWVGLVNKLQARLSKWKVKTLSIGGRLTLLKSVLGASPIYYMSIFKVPKGVLKTMESIRSKFFNGVDSSDRKISWVAWDNVLASKLNGGLGVSSFFALNRALLLKWVWRFISGDGSLWCKVIQAIYGSKFDLHVTDQPSIWCSILREVKSLKDSGFDFSSHCKKRIGDGSCTSFWYDIWLADAPLCVQFPRLFALELDKEIVVANKMGASSVSASFRRDVRDGAERQQWDDLSSIMNSVVLSSSKDRWTCDLSGDGEFKVKVIRNFIDDLFLPSSDVATRWVKFIPIKVNVFSWRARRDRLPTRVNLSRRGVLLDSHLCPLCNAAMEDVQHVFFRCDVARVVLRKICRWWDLDWQEICSFSDWDAWFLSFRLSSRLKSILEGVFYVAWWRIWRLRNQLVFDASPPNRSTIFDDIVSLKGISEYVGQQSMEGEIGDKASSSTSSKQHSLAIVTQHQNSRNALLAEGVIEPTLVMLKVNFIFSELLTIHVFSAANIVLIIYMVGLPSLDVVIEDFVVYDVSDLYTIIFCEGYQIAKGIPTHSLNQVLKEIISSANGMSLVINGVKRPMPLLRILKVELYPTLLYEAQSFKLRNNWIQALVEKDPVRFQVLQVQGHKIELLVGTDTRDGIGTTRTINWCGCLVQYPHPAVHALGFLPEEGHGD